MTVLVCVELVVINGVPETVFVTVIVPVTVELDVLLGVPVLLGVTEGVTEDVDVHELVWMGVAVLVPV